MGTLSTYVMWSPLTSLLVLMVSLFWTYSTLQQVNVSTYDRGIHDNVAFKFVNYLFVWICLLGVMAARGLLTNPAMFTGYEDTPLECIWDWVDISIEQGTPFTCFHHHLIYMLERVSSQPERKVFNSLSSTSAVIDYLQDTYGSVHDLGTWAYWNVMYLILACSIL